jgi:hypothetical protein
VGVVVGGVVVGGVVVEVVEVDVVEDVEDVVVVPVCADAGAALATKTATRATAATTILRAVVVSEGVMPAMKVGWCNPNPRAG